MFPCRDTFADWRTGTAPRRRPADGKASQFPRRRRHRLSVQWLDGVQHAADTPDSPEPHPDGSGQRLPGRIGPVRGLAERHQHAFQVSRPPREATECDHDSEGTGQTTTSPPNDSPHALRDLNFGRIDQISSHVYRREMFRRQIRGTTGIIARAMPVNMPMKWAVFAIGPNTPKTHIPAKNNVYCTWSRPMWTP